MESKSGLGSSQKGHVIFRGFIFDERACQAECPKTERVVWSFWQITHSPTLSAPSLPYVYIIPEMLNIISCLVLKMFRKHVDDDTFIIQKNHFLEIWKTCATIGYRYWFPQFEKVMGNFQEFPLCCWSHFSTYSNLKQYAHGILIPSNIIWQSNGTLNESIVAGEIWGKDRSFSIGMYHPITHFLQLKLELMKGLALL